MALGARRTSIVGMIISEILKIGTAGVVFGILSSLAASRLLAGMLYQVKPMEFHIMAGAAGLLVAAVLLATLFAARRAMNVDPAIALRHD